MLWRRALQARERGRGARHREAVALAAGLAPCASLARAAVPSELCTTHVPHQSTASRTQRARLMISSTRLVARSSRPVAAALRRTPLAALPGAPVRPASALAASSAQAVQQQTTSSMADVQAFIDGLNAAYEKVWLRPTRTRDLRAGSRSPGELSSPCVRAGAPGVRDQLLGDEDEPHGRCASGHGACGGARRRWQRRCSKDVCASAWTPRHAGCELGAAGRHQERLRGDLSASGVVLRQQQLRRASRPRRTMVTPT